LKTILCLVTLVLAPFGAIGQDLEHLGFPAGKTESEHQTQPTEKNREEVQQPVQPAEISGKSEIARANTETESPTELVGQYQGLKAVAGSPDYSAAARVVARQEMEKIRQELSRRIAVAASAARQAGNDVREVKSQLKRLSSSLAGLNKISKGDHQKLETLLPKIHDEDLVWLWNNRKKLDGLLRSAANLDWQKIARQGNEAEQRDGVLLTRSVFTLIWLILLTGLIIALSWKSRRA
jgi:hypothetical protein